MGIFTRLRDIISSNINAMLDKAEDPEKLIRLMIQEMEDTLVEVKASCAGVIAARKNVERELESARRRVDRWEENAELAVRRERDDLAREALVAKRRYQERAEALEREMDRHNALIDQYQDDIVQLEEKLAEVRERQRVLVHRHIHARNKKLAEQEIRRADTTDAFVRFEKFRNRIDRMEAEADLVNYGRKPSLEEELARLEVDEEIEGELQQIKERLASSAGDASS
jgi:phage shock protein A